MLTAQSLTNLFLCSSFDCGDNWPKSEWMEAKSFIKIHNKPEWIFSWKFRLYSGLTNRRPQQERNRKTVAKPRDTSLNYSVCSLSTNCSLDLLMIYRREFCIFKRGNYFRSWLEKRFHFSANFSTEANLVVDMLVMHLSHLDDWSCQFLGKLFQLFASFINKTLFILEVWKLPNLCVIFS